jgi:putative hydrolase of the HAD superfamily
MSAKVEAVLFDFGGVVLSSPLHAFRDYEAAHGLPSGFLGTVNQQNPHTNAWACMERGEIDEAEFYRRFEDEGRALGHAIDGRAILKTLTGVIVPEMVEEIKTLRSKYRVACLTNNMAIGHGTAMAQDREAAAAIADVMTLFEKVFESRLLGMRKPEARFFEKACADLGVRPEACVFLDDLGMNLKAARALGMQTIKVTSPTQGIADLRAVLAG